MEPTYTVFKLQSALWPSQRHPHMHNVYVSVRDADNNWSGPERFTVPTWECRPHRVPVVMLNEERTSQWVCAALVRGKKVVAWEQCVGDSKDE